jgi:hypothetical protein
MDTAISSMKRALAKGDVRCLSIDRRARKTHLCLPLLLRSHLGLKLHPSSAWSQLVG